MLASTPDLLRLLAVPVFAWAAYRDRATRRVPNRTWLPLVAVGVLALAWDGWLLRDAGAFRQRLFLVRVVVSLGLVAPLGYVFWRVGGFGGADAKGLIALAVLFPAYPVFYLPFDALPLVRANLGVFSLTILTNTVLFGLAYPLVLAATNAAHGRFAPAMLVGRPVSTRTVTETYGRLLETPEGFTRSGLDIDALRMYLRWRDASLAAVRTNPEEYRDPASLPAIRSDPGDGALADGGRTVADESDAARAGDAVEAPEDAWGAATFVAEIDGSAYGTTPESLRAGLEVLVARETVWVTPGIPFIVPMFAGLLAALTVGDLMFAALALLGVVAG
ncbi:MAG: prepilin peptidase [Haloarculaceae archaeon]